jgi:small subunit ribosomal protein S4
MARLLAGPKCRMCRREGMKLYLKGPKCEGDKCTLNHRTQAPGQHGTSRRSISEYGRQLREKQKAKRIYGLLEKQFKNYVNKALKTKGVTGDILIQELESRLDNMVYRSGFAVSRGQARQLIRQGMFLVNEKQVNIPSQKIRIGDVIKPISFEKIHLREGFVLPEWIEANVKDKLVKFSRLPTQEDMQERVDIPLIVEYYSR